LYNVCPITYKYPCYKLSLKFSQYYMQKINFVNKCQLINTAGGF
jgi:hypothetical protein